MTDVTGQYIKFASGLIIQWGLASGIPSGGTTNVTYPISFSAGNCYALTSSVYNTTSTAPTNPYSYEVYTTSKSGFSIKSFSSIQNGVKWMAIGR
jgi:hypothetical protein